MNFIINDTTIKLNLVLHSPNITRNIISSIKQTKICIKSITEPLNNNSNIIKLTIINSNNKIIYKNFFHLN